MKPELKLVENTGSMLEQNTFETPPQQTEMPFAIVEGEPLTELPKDLYIPPDALQVFLEAFEGPLDLLLYLIRRQNLDILDIPIAEITRQYMQYIEVMTELHLELAGEYLLMAAMLAEIKSRMLLPRPKTEEGQEEEDPRAELVRRLQEYERFKKAAEDLDRLPRMERDTLPASVELPERKVVRIPPKVTLQEMLLAFRDVLQRAELFAHHHISRERLSVRQRMSDILGALRETAFVEFVRLFRPEEGRMGVTVTFIAMLELMKEGLLEIVQAEPYAPIHVRPAGSTRQTAVAADNDPEMTDADAENVAALAQPALPDEDEEDEEELEFTVGDLPDEDTAEADATVQAPTEVEQVSEAADVSSDTEPQDASLADGEGGVSDLDDENTVAVDAPAQSSIEAQAGESDVAPDSSDRNDDRSPQADASLDDDTVTDASDHADTTRQDP
jgi:segregation and condensation protein A